jgi:parallel beta-helix repeat protein
MFRQMFFNAMVMTTVPAALAATAFAGDLNPPVGPVAPTHKTLTEVEPRTAVNATNTPGDADSLLKITLPGSYYLTGNITGVSGKHGVEIAASGVTLDLNGFDLVGDVGSLDGVSATMSLLASIAVVNGSIRFWGDEGVDLGTAFATNCRVADLIVGGNIGNGISVADGSAVLNCMAFGSGGNGISVGPGSTILNCVAYTNGAIGISTGNRCLVSNCSATFNTGAGIVVANGSRVSNFAACDNSGVGISAGNGSTVADSTARANSLDGIMCSAACVIRGNTCAGNGRLTGDGAGVHATSNDNRIEGNNCTGADRGIDVDSVGNIIIKNTCASNGTDWDIAADNVFGPILDRRAPASAAVLGFSAASSLGSTEPNANFSY